ncbi:MAG: ornithine cyclodeaminase family protein [Nitrospinae bacterium]|nr:ornithine cyclodeaminase family protein [Nitrospinota bacterium]
MNPIILEKEDILNLLDFDEIIGVIEKSFVDFSTGKALMPTPQDIILEEFKGETHVKSAYVKGSKYYCIKIASGFYDNPKIGLNSSQGMMILIEAKTGLPKCILLEEGQLTDFRTAAAGAVAAKYLANKGSEKVLVVGTGIQAKLQVEFLLRIMQIKILFVWGRSEEKAKDYCKHLQTKSPALEIKIVKNMNEARNLAIDIIVTATPSRKPLVPKNVVEKGVHLNAIGADMPGKHELDENILSAAKVITDSTAQCSKSGELQHALSAGVMKVNDVHGELGEVISNNKKGRDHPEEITVFDSTGLGVQDLAIARYVFDKYCEVNKEN